MLNYYIKINLHFSGTTLPCPLPSGHFDPESTTGPSAHLLPLPAQMQLRRFSPAPSPLSQDSLPASGGPFHSVSSSSSSSSNYAALATGSGGEHAATATGSGNSSGGGSSGAAAIAIIDSLFRCHRSNADDADEDEDEEEVEDEADEDVRRGGHLSFHQRLQPPAGSSQGEVRRLGGHWSSSSTEFLDEADQPPPVGWRGQQPQESCQPPRPRDGEGGCANQPLFSSQVERPQPPGVEWPSNCDIFQTL